jgi:hypothetical protein
VQWADATGADAIVTSRQMEPRAAEAALLCNCKFEGVVTDLLISVFGSSDSQICVDVELGRGTDDDAVTTRYAYALSSGRRS